MILFKKADDVRFFTAGNAAKGLSIGFVPTMGALHAGHLSLVAASKEANDVTVASIFINPTQFNNPEDFMHYPVTVEKDIEALIGSGCDALFLPPVDQVYPKGYSQKQYALGPIETVLEGGFRPGHFQGVCGVVERLLQIVGPQRLYLGQKDLQQCMVIRKMLQLTGLEIGIDLQIVPTQREPDGLAMSSRNLRLSAEQRSIAPAIHAELAMIKTELTMRPFKELTRRAVRRLTEKGFTVDYIQIADRNDLSPAHDTSVPLVALAAATIGNVRLIDNLLLN